MEITGIEFQKKHDDRANLYVDDEFYAGVSVELVMKNQLKKGMTISKEELDEIILEDEKQSAFSKAVKYMSSALKTEKQIKDYLRKKEYNPGTIEYVIDKLIEYKYLDDEAYARSFVLTYSSKYGKLKLIAGLKSKGVSDRVIDNVFSEDLEIKNNTKETAEKYLKNKTIDNNTYLKLSRFLYSRGYEFDEINRVINELKGK
jgi:regulatory protein